MQKRIKLIFLALVLPVMTFAQGLTGSWSLISHESTEIDLYNNLQVDLDIDDDILTVVQLWGRGRSYADTISLSLEGDETRDLIHHRVFPTNVFMGLSMPVGQDRTLKARWLEPGRAIQVDETFQVRGSQGLTPLEVTHTYRLAENDETLFYELSRSTRPENGAIRYRLKRTGTKEAYYMELEDDWRVDGHLDQQACLITLQGLANLEGANLYFHFPETWDFNYTRAVFDFYKTDRFYTFKKLRSLEHAIRVFQDDIKGYVVWDKHVRTSLIVAFTVAGLERAVVVSPDMVPLMDKYNIPEVENFVGKFTGQSDYEIYSWAYDMYWDRCSKDLIIWMGGHHGNIMKPGIADWGIYNKAFFQDLSTKPEDEDEYRLANKLLGELNPMSMVMGWHSYKKDKERDHVRLTSSYGHRVKGLHTLPNTSFSYNVSMTPGFEFKNNHNIKPEEQYTPQDKVYVTCVQTDGVGLGAWTKEGRGDIPYAWCLGLNDLWLGPAMLEFFYRQSTPNDYFIGGTTPGYMYPKMIPDSLRPELLGMAQQMLDSLDLVITQTMDYSQGATVEGNTELTREVVDAFYQYLPHVEGFLNGYAPAYTFAERNNIPLVSYDYYLSPSRPVQDAVADFEELAAINSKRPYFLVAHIRQWSDIKRVKTILDQLGPEFEIVPLDVFMKLAGKEPTFEERYLEQPVE
jgi:hypothetical protein